MFQDHPVNSPNQIGYETIYYTGILVELCYSSMPRQPPGPRPALLIRLGGSSSLGLLQHSSETLPVQPGDLLFKILVICAPE